jgi:tetratricopeptide (TPR) repeat protein
MEQAVELDPTYSPNLANLGALYRERGDLAQSVDSFTRSTELAPEWALWHLNLGEVYELQESWELSARSYQEALSLEPSWVVDGYWAETSFRSQVLKDWQALRPDAHEDEIQLTEEELIAQSVAAPILERAAQKISEMDFKTAERLLGIAEFAHFRRYTERLELVWLKAEIAASKEDWSRAISLAEEALDGFRYQGAYGPGGAGETLYGTMIFRRQIMEVELVPQLTLIHLPDPWPQRMVKLGSWYKEAGDLPGCRATMDELLQEIPNLRHRFPELDLYCLISK